MKRFLSSFLLFLLIFAVAGCAEPEPTATPVPEPTATLTPTPVPTATATATPRPTPSPTPSPTPLAAMAILERAREAYADVETVRMSGTMTMTMTMGGGGMTFEIPILAEQAYQAPDRFHATLSFSFMGEEADMEMIAIGSDLYSREDPGDGWIYEVSERNENKQTGLEELLVFDRDLFEELALIGTEQIEGIETYHVRGRVSMEELALSLDLFEGLPVGGEDAMVDADYWIGTEDFLMQMGASTVDFRTDEEGMEMEFTLVTELRYYDYNAALEVEAPAAEDVLNVMSVEPGASLPDALGMIAFQSDREGNSDVFVMNANGSDPVNLTQHAAMDMNPAWSPDGQRLTFISDRDGLGSVYVMTADGAAQMRLAQRNQEQFKASWSPDGAQIVFDAALEGDAGTFMPTLYTINPAGWGEVRLIAEDTSDFWPAWSPDGSRIAFTSNRHGNSEIYVMNADGSEQVRLTNTSSEGWQNWWPAWSPDGERIVFSSRRARGDADIYVMNADGSDLVRLTYDEADDYLASWSPDGAYIAFASMRDGNHEIYIIRADGKALWRITNNPAEDTLPVWKP